MDELTLQDDQVKLEVLRLKNDGYSNREISKVTGIPRSTLGDFFLQITHKEWWQAHSKPIAGGDFDDHHSDLAELQGDRFIFLTAQNNTFVNKAFWNSIKVAAEHLDAQIVVGTFTYGKALFTNHEKGEDWIDPLIRDYVLDKPARIADGLLWLGELNINPTAVNPLSGLHSYARGDSAIIPHVKVQLESLPRFKGEEPRFLYTTGAITKRNYIQKKTGQKASFDHVYGGMLVEVDSDGKWYARQITADDDGSFYDLDTLYTPEGVKTGQNVLAINYGDIHAEKMDKEVAFGSFDKSNPENLTDKLKPEYVFLHDVIDFTTRNHHNIKDPYFRFMSHHHSSDTVQDDLNKTANIISDIYRDWLEVVVVESNHDLALKKWLKESCYKNDPANAVLFLELQLAQYKAMEAGDSNFQIFEHSMKQVCDVKEDVRFLRTDESFRLQDIEYGVHGHAGVNGSRGSPQGYTRVGSKVNTGHTHSCKIISGVYVAGVTAKLDMGYNNGYSTWSHSHIVTYKNGKRAIITMRGNKYKAEDKS